MLWARRPLYENTGEAEGPPQQDYRPEKRGGLVIEEYLNDQQLLLTVELVSSQFFAKPWRTGEERRIVTRCKELEDCISKVLPQGLRVRHGVDWMIYCHT